jgi:hypothetical protein
MITDPRPVARDNAGWNAGQYGLLWFGLLAAVGGVVTAVVAWRRAASSARVADLAEALYGFPQDGGGVASVVMWVGVGVAVLGVLVLVVLAGIRAARD